MRMGDDELKSQYLSHLTMVRESKSFTDCLYAVLTGCGHFQGPKYMLSGLTAMAFKFAVHQRLEPLSVTAYGQWGVEHWPAVDNLGVFTVTDGGYVRHPTFPSYQKDAVQAVKESLNQGKGVIYWLPEFAVIRGYDDGDGVFYLMDGSAEDQILLYDNFGLNVTPFWNIQLFGDKVVVPEKDMILESVRMAVSDWETPYKTLPSKDIASGRLAYDYLMNGLRGGIFDENGAVYILESYAYSRKEIRDYLRQAKGIWPELHPAFMLYNQLAGMLETLPEMLIQTSHGKQVNRSAIFLLLDMLHQAQSIEDQAMMVFREMSRSYPDRKRSTLPRWGAHTVR